MRDSFSATANTYVRAAATLYAKAFRLVSTFIAGRKHTGTLNASSAELAARAEEDAWAHRNTLHATEVMFLARVLQAFPNNLATSHTDGSAKIARALTARQLVSRVSKTPAAYRLSDPVAARISRWQIYVRRRQAK